MGTGAIIVVVLGLLLLYGGVTGKLDCFLQALESCRAAQAAQTNALGAGATTAPTTMPQILTPPTF